MHQYNAALLQQIANPRPLKLPDPVEGISNALQLRNQVQAGQMNAIALQKAQQDQLDQAKTRDEAAKAHQILIETQGDFEKALPRFATETPTLYPKMLEFVQQQKKSAQELSSAALTGKHTQQQMDLATSKETRDAAAEQRTVEAATRTQQLEAAGTIVPGSEHVYMIDGKPQQGALFRTRTADGSVKDELRAIGVAAAAPVNPPQPTAPMSPERFEQEKGLRAITAAARTTATGGAAGSGDNIRDTAEGIINGSLPPPDLSSRPTQFSLALTGELNRRGFDLSTHRRDWVAVQKHLATLNGAQQERLRQAIQFTAETIPQIEDAFQEWKKQAGIYGYKILNRANLAAMKQLSGAAGSAAHNLDALISDFTSELGTVYKGGNSSTDESLKLAAQNLSTEWNERTFTDAIARLKRSMAIRRNSIATSQPQGVSPNSPYSPAPPTATPSTPARNNRPPLSSFER